MTVLASRGQLRASFLRWALVIVPAVLLAGFLSAQVAGSAADNPWFASLAKPAIYPAPRVFAIVWPVLYALMGVALTLVITARGARGRGWAIALFGVQLALNLAWSPLFFAAHRIEASLWLLVALDFAVLATIALFWRVRTAAALLLLPYLAWIGFATWLNLEFLRANPGEGEGRGATTRIEL